MATPKSFVADSGPSSFVPEQAALPKKKQPLANRVANSLGFEKTVDTIGSGIAKIMVPKEQRQFVPTPTLKDAAGAALNVGSTLIPVGAVQKTVASVAGRVAAPILAGAAAGYTGDVGRNLEQGKQGAAIAKPGVGTAIGAAIPGAQSTVQGVKAVAADAAPRLINSLIKPLSKQFTYGKNPGRAVAELGITGNSLEELATSISSARKQVGDGLQQLADRVRLQQPLALSKALSPFDDAITKAVNSNDQALLNRLNEARNALTSIFAQKGGKIVANGSRILDGLDYKQGLELKRRIGDLTKWTGQRTEDETVNGALTRAYALVKGELDKAATLADPEAAKGLRKLNEQYADLTSAEIAAKYRDVLEQRQNLINLPGKIGLTASLAAAPFTGGLSTVLAAGGSIVADKVLSSPAVKTRAAKFLAKAAPSKAPFTSPGDLLLKAGQKGAARAQATPNKEGGFARVPGRPSLKVAELQKNRAAIMEKVAVTSNKTLKAQLMKAVRQIDETMRGLKR